MSPRLKRCPKCSSVTVRWYEVYEQPMFWDQTADGIDPDGTPSNAGDILRIRGQCLNQRCLHKWTPRGIRQITDLPGLPS